MPRLLTDEQVERIANDAACAIVGEIERMVGGLTSWQRAGLEEGLDSDLTDLLEGLMEPDEEVSA